MKKLILLSFLFAFLMVHAQEQSPVVITNPINISYRFQTPDVGTCYRETADPVIVLYNDRYYLFASHSSGYWYSDNMKDWTYLPTKNLKAVEAWAPAVMVYNGALYYLGMNESRIFRSTDPSSDEWEELPMKCGNLPDPAFFQDTDGKVYVFYGCSDHDPIKGCRVDPENGFMRIGEEHELIHHSSGRFGWEVFGDRNERYDIQGWNEGPCITKNGDLYYLMYAAPGTELSTYCTGIYVSENPLGPYVNMPDSPYAIKPGGFSKGAGHGHPFKDRYGNDWFVATLTVAAKKPFEWIFSTN